jgi:hypothetical protein
VLKWKLQIQWLLSHLRRILSHVLWRKLRIRKKEKEEGK